MPTYKKVYQEVRLKGMAYVCLILMTLPLLKAQTEQYVKTGYFTHVFAREHVSDMPRGFYLLIEADGTINPLWFYRLSTQNTGQFSVWNFDPRDYLGQVISVDITAKSFENNSEFTRYEGTELKVIPQLVVDRINSWTVTSGSITVPPEYQYPQTDTLLIPHDVLVAEQPYADQTPSDTVQLTAYVQGAGTEASPYFSSDGSAGLKAAMADMPSGGTIEVAPGYYRITTNRLDIARFISIKGVGSSKPVFLATLDYVWRLKGSNTLENITVDMRPITRFYTHQVIVIDNNARDVWVKNSKFMGRYSVEPGTYAEDGRVVCFRMMSHLNNITFEQDTFQNLLRHIVTKGQRNQHNLTVRNCLFSGSNHMSMSMDQVSNISNVLIENNEFRELSHFGIAFARINDVTLRNNVFYSRNKLAFNTYNRAIHIEERCQNFVIENNVIDVLMRHSDSDNPNTVIRNPAIGASDSRHLLIQNNTILNSDVLFNGVMDLIGGRNEVLNNRIENGSIQIRESNRYIRIKNNELLGPPESAISMLSVRPMVYPFGWHQIESNVVTELDDKMALDLRGEILNVTLSNNDFQGCNQQGNSLELYDGSESLTIAANNFYGLSAANAFDLTGNLPPGNSLNQYQSDNAFSLDCNVISTIDEIEDVGLRAFPNPVQMGETVTIKGNAPILEFMVYDLAGSLILADQGHQVQTRGLSSGLYLVKVHHSHATTSLKLRVQ